MGNMCITELGQCMQCSALSHNLATLNNPAAPSACATPRQKMQVESMLLASQNCQHQIEKIVILGFPDMHPTTI